MPIDRNTILWLTAVGMIGILGGVRARRTAVAAPTMSHDPPRPPREPGDSPLPAERYGDLDEDGLEWVNPRPVPLDAAFTAAVRRFAASGGEERARMRAAAGGEGVDPLRAFANRAALFGLRERSTDRLRDGLAAVAMTDSALADPRDVVRTMGLLHHSAVRLGAEPRALFHEAAALAEGEVRELLTGFPARPAEQKDLHTGCWMKEVQLPDGPVFMEWGHHPYHPTRDLVPLAVDVARAMSAGEYRANPPWIGYPLPAGLLEGAGDLERPLRGIRAGARISAWLRPGVGPDPLQPIMLYLVEAAGQEDARALVNATERARSESRQALLGLSQGPYFLLLEAGPGARHTQDYETPERLARFAAPLGDVLRRHAAPP